MTGKGYGAYGGGNDPNNMDLRKFPRWREVPWYDATLEKGDCIFIPTSWYHQVHTPPQRSIAVNIWWWRRDGPYTPEELKEWDACPHREKKIPISDCTFGYQGPPNHPESPFKAHKITKCKGIDMAPQTRDAFSQITKWQRFPERSLLKALRLGGINEYTAPIETQVRIMEEHTKKQNAKGPRPEDEQEDEDDDDEL